MSHVLALIARYKFWLVSCAVATFLGIATMGIFGAALLESFNFIRSLYGQTLTLDDYGENAWPIAIWYSLVTPAVFFVYALILQKFFNSLTHLRLFIPAAFLAYCFLYCSYMFIPTPDTKTHFGTVESTTKHSLNINSGDKLWKL